MENVIVTYFNVESEAYQALSEIKNITTYEDRILFSQVALLKKNAGVINYKDGFDTGRVTLDDTKKGGLIGGLVGILGGPLGILLGLGVGSLAGAAVDTRDTKEENSLVSTVTSRMQEDDVAIIAVVQEDDETIYNRIIDNFDATTIRFDASTIQEEIEHAKEVEEHLQDQAKIEMKEERSEKRNTRVEQMKEKVKNDFNDIKRGFSSKDK